jgi:hypothetical protein
VLLPADVARYGRACYDNDFYAPRERMVVGLPFLEEVDVRVPTRPVPPSPQRRLRNVNAQRLSAARAPYSRKEAQPLYHALTSD